jgi:hypothetical protein
MLKSNNMKRLIIFFISAFILSACSSEDLSGTQASTKKPRIPRTPVAQANMEADLLGSTKTQIADKDENEDEYMKGLLGRINQNLEQRNITLEDIDRGWYYGSEDERKWGTPAAWIWVNEGSKSHWISPSALEQEKDMESDQLCRGTGGYYVISCVERDLPHCEHISTSECRCSDGTKWVDDQGCVVWSSDNGFVEITQDDIKQGWYLGTKNGKKLNTPTSWILSENGSNSRWQNPGTL